MKTKLVSLALGWASLSGCATYVEPSPQAPVEDAPASVAIEPAGPAEACNALDDDGDGVVDEGPACTAACSTDAMARAAASLRLPREGDLTVPHDSQETPALLAYNHVPDFCTAVTPASSASDVTVACGQILDVDHVGLAAKTLRVAPGGVVRLTESALLDLAEEILVCPGAVIQSGVGLALHGGGRDGSNIELRAERLVMLGAIATRGGWVTEAATDRPGRSGALRVQVDRLLFSGAIDTAELPPRGYRSGEPGDVSILATKESFFSGHVRSGNAWVKLPVCCAAP